MIRAVVDTNVLVSALIAPAGNEALILLAIRQGLVKPSFSEEILMEYAEVWLGRNSAWRLMKSKHSSLSYEVRARRSGNLSRFFQLARSRGRQVFGMR